MPSKAKSVRELRAALDAWKENKLPQQGFFSTLDELIATAPEETMPAYMWQRYLQAGRRLVRDGIEFPLKKEELEYGKVDKLHDPVYHPGLTDVTPDTRLTKDQVRQFVQANRPEIGVDLRTNDSRAWHNVLKEPWLEERGFDPEQMRTRVHGVKYDSPGLLHRAADGDSRYEENITVSPDVGDFRSHFSPQDISWSRTTRHDSPDQGTTRLIEEIQSDRHSKAGEKIFDHDLADRLRAEGNTGDIGQATRRRGYRNSEIEDERLSLRDKLYGWEKGQDWASGKVTIPDDIVRLKQRLSDINQMPPDAPYKDPRDYATLEMRKQLLNSVAENDRFLALTRGADQISRYSGGMDDQRSRGMQEMYDKVYPSILKKEAGRYGAKMVDKLELPVVDGVSERTRPGFMVYDGHETINDFFDTVHHVARDPESYGYHLGYALNNMFDDMADDPAAIALKAQFDAIQAKLNVHDVSEEAQVASSQAHDTVTDMYHLWMQHHGNKGKEGFKDFPAAEITPEVAERVKKVGVPIFSVGAAAASQLLPDDEQPPQYADGGFVAKKEKDDESLWDDAKRVASGFTSQWMAVDPETGEHYYTPLHNIMVDWNRKSRKDAGLPPQKYVRPGIVHETLALPELGELIPGVEAPQWAHDASDMADLTHHEANDVYGLGEAHGFKQHALESLGTMAGQIPIPSSTMNKLRLLREGAEVPKWMKRMSKAGEWFSPTIEPAVSNYAVGTGVGAGIGTGLEALQRKAARDQDKADIQEAMAQALAEAHDDSDLDEAVETMAALATTAPQAKPKFGNGGAVAGVGDLRKKVLANDRTIKTSNPGYSSIYDPPVPQNLPNAPGAASVPAGTGQNAQANFNGVDFEHYGQGPEHDFFPDRKYPPVVLQPGSGLPGGQGGGGGGGSSGGGSNAGSALGTVMGIIKTGGQVKDLYNRGRDLYNQYRYGNSAGAQTFDQWAAQNDPNWLNRAQSEWGGNLESLMTAAGSGILTRGATDPAGNVTVSALDGDEAQYNSGQGGGSGGGPGGYSAAVGSGVAAGTLAPALRAGTVSIAGLGAEEVAGQAGTQLAAEQGASSAGAGAGAGAGVTGVLGKALAVYGAYQGIKGMGAAYRQGDVKDGMVAGATAGASIGSVIPVLGTVAGGVIGGALGALYTGASNHTTESNTQKAAWSQFNKVPENASFRGSGFPTTAAFDGAMRTSNDKDPALLKAIGDVRDSGYPSSLYLTSYLKNQIREAQAAGKLPPDGQLANIDGHAFLEKELLPKIYGPNGAPRNDKVRKLLGTMTDELFYYGVAEQNKPGTADFTRTNAGGNTYFDEAAARASGQH